MKRPVAQAKRNEVAAEHSIKLVNNGTNLGVDDAENSSERDTSLNLEEAL